MKAVRVGVTDLKAHLSHYLGQAKAGTVVLVTEWGRPIARIMPAGDEIEWRLWELVAGGFAQWSGRRLKPGKPVARSRGGTLLSDLIIEDRR